MLRALRKTCFAADLRRGTRDTTKVTSTELCANLWFGRLSNTTSGGFVMRRLLLPSVVFIGSIVLNISVLSAGAQQPPAQDPKSAPTANPPAASATNPP